MPYRGVSAIKTLFLDSGTALGFKEGDARGVIVADNAVLLVERHLPVVECRT